MSKRAPRAGLGPPVPSRIEFVPQGRPGDRDARRRALIVAAVVGIAVAAGGAVAALDPFRATAATHSEVSRGADPPSLATIRQGSLSSQISQSGTLDYANPETVYGLLSGTITWLPSGGQVIKPGQTPYKVDNKPVVLFKGNVPRLPRPRALNRPRDRHRPRRDTNRAGATPRRALDRDHLSRDNAPSRSARRPRRTAAERASPTRHRRRSSKRDHRDGQSLSTARPGASRTEQDRDCLTETVKAGRAQSTAGAITLPLLPIRGETPQTPPQRPADTRALPRAGRRARKRQTRDWRLAGARSLPALALLLPHRGHRQAPR